MFTTKDIGIQLNKMNVCNVSTLQTVYKQVLDQRNNFAHECDILRRSATPR